MSDKTIPPPMPANRVLAALTSQSGWGALLLFACAGVVMTEVSGLRLGTADAMGPGYFPMLLGLLFVLFGALVGVDAWRHPEQRVKLGALRPLVLLLGGIVLFALLLKAIGGALAIAVLVVVTALAERGRSVMELALLSLGVIALVWVIFVLALGLQIEMLPGWWT